MLSVTRGLLRPDLHAHVGTGKRCPRSAREGFHAPFERRSARSANAARSHSRLHPRRCGTGSQRRLGSRIRCVCVVFRYEVDCEGDAFFIAFARARMRSGLPPSAPGAGGRRMAWRRGAAGADRCTDVVTAGGGIPRHSSRREPRIAARVRPSVGVAGAAEDRPFGPLVCLGP